MQRGPVHQPSAPGSQASFVVWQQADKKLFAAGVGTSIDYVVARYFASCGDAVLDAASEACDDANAVDGDGCDSNCTLTACGNAVATAGEECDDANVTNGDGCDTNCTLPRCGNGARAPGEVCDDGNLVGGDGCENDCSYTPVVQTASAGATVTTDASFEGATPERPVQTTITTPNAGEITITASPATAAPTGLAVVGATLRIEAPPATAQAPLAITLRVDHSAIPAEIGAANLDVSRDGVVIAACSGPSGTAAPDPCVSARSVLPDGDAEITVLTSHASLWSTVARGLTKAEQTCVNGINGAGAKVAAAQAKAASACIKAAAKGAEADPQGCLTADANQKIAAATAKTTEVAANACVPAPAFGFTSAVVVNDAAQLAPLDLVAVVFGAALNTAVLATTSDPAGAKCQGSLLESLQKLAGAEAKAFLKCAKIGLQGKKTAVIFSATEFSHCLHEIGIDADGKWAKASAKLVATLDSACPEFTLPNSIPGGCAHGPTPPVCFRRKVDCGVCRMFRDTNDLGIDCDLFDDGVSDSSCL
ncbi:MAG: DUF4215 domain-containing protein [Deltaproteobacteria bacterium]|nr:DUF4215 domain-containing protein [Deltaproteobacteria bacterium]